MSAALHFDEATHTYRVDGVRYPSVTEVLGDLSAREYRHVARAVMEEAAWFGSAVHKVIELDNAGTLDESALDDRLAPYLERWRQFRAHSGFVPILSEARVFSRRYGYAGTLDLFGLLNGEAALVDAKRCASVPRTAGPQTAAYEFALRECMPDVVARAASGPGAGRISRFALHLTPATKIGWALIPFKAHDDARVFLSALNLYQWERKKA